MRHLKFLHFLLLITLCSCDSCREKDWTELPPETQTGANTFGCYVNGELFIAERGYGFGMPNNYPLSIYSRSNNALSASASGRKGHIYIYIYDPKERINSLEFMMYYNDFYFDREMIDIKERNRGKIYLTKFDTINQIASGIFSDIILINTQTDTQNIDSVIITQGRFDIKLEMYNN